MKICLKFKEKKPNLVGINENFRPIIKTLLREGLLLEVDNRQKIIKFSGDPKLADFAHEISNKYSVWIANQMINNKLLDVGDIESVKEKFLQIIEFFKIQNRPSINLKTLDLNNAVKLKDKYQYISDWVNNPNVPYENLTKLTWDEAEKKAIEWHETLKGGEVDNILDDSEILHKFSDGYMWVLTKDQYCEASEKSMGHCATATKSDMYLLRLIKGNEEFVTMDWHPNHKYIIQIKGKQNTKPVPKYYPYIVYILKNPNMVSDLRMDEGYRPETNLQLEDLSVEQGKEILDNNYNLFKDERSVAKLFYNCKEPYNIILMLGDSMDMVIDDSQVIFEIFQNTSTPIKTLDILESIVGFTHDDLLNVYEGSNLENSINNSNNKEEMRKLLLQQTTINETIKNLFREAIDKTITCSKCGWEWRLKDGGDDPYVCHKCHPNKENLNERLLTKKEKDIKVMGDFVNFAKKQIGIDDDVKVLLAYERTPDIKTTAYYNLEGFVKIYVKDRAIIDVCRSIAHELVHHKQNIDGRLKDSVKDGEDGSEIENEANAIAGVVIRKWGKLYPELYI